MKKVIIIVMLLFIFSNNVYAETSKNDISAKYEENYINFTKGKINEKKAIINIDDIELKFTTTSKKDNELDIIVIPVTDEALEWLSKTQDNKISNITGYFIKFQRNKKDVEPKGTITIESKVKNSYDNLVMVFINSKGKLVNSTNKIKNDLISLNITKEGYLAYGESEHEFDKSTNQNPQTFDKIINYFTLGILSFIGIITMMIYLKKKSIKNNF